MTSPGVVSRRSTRSENKPPPRAVFLSSSACWPRLCGATFSAAAPIVWQGNGGRGMTSQAQRRGSGCGQRYFGGRVDATRATTPRDFLPPIFLPALRAETSRLTPTAGLPAPRHSFACLHSPAPRLVFRAARTPPDHLVEGFRDTGLDLQRAIHRQFGQANGGKRMEAGESRRGDLGFIPLPPFPCQLALFCCAARSAFLRLETPARGWQEN